MPKDFLGPIYGALALAIGGTLSAWVLARSRAGRLSRTLEQAQKVMDFVERWIKIRTELQALPNQYQEQAEHALNTAFEAVSQDFEAEREILPQFSGTVSSVRRVFLLGVPRHSLVWFPQILFHGLLIFVVWVIAARAFHVGGWSWRSSDTTAVALAIAAAAIDRALIHAFSQRGL